MRVVFKYILGKGWVILQEDDNSKFYKGFGIWKNGTEGEQPFYFPSAHHASTTSKSNGFIYCGVLDLFDFGNEKEGGKNGD